MGTEGKAVQERFAVYLTDQSLNPAQIRFVELIADQLTTTKVLDSEGLYEQPFSSLHAKGPDALFTDTTVLEGIFEEVEQLSHFEG